MLELLNNLETLKQALENMTDEDIINSRIELLNLVNDSIETIQ